MLVVGLIVFTSAFLAPILSDCTPVAAQAGVSGGSEETIAQTDEKPSPQGVIRITVHLVQVDAVVTDSKGHQVTNLGPADFEILEDGRPQTITNFSYIATGKPPSIEAHAATPPAAAGVPAVAPARLQPEQVRRTIVVLVDDLHIAFENIVYVRQALRKFIDDSVQPGDLVAILHTSGGLGVRQQFTNDKRLLHAVVDGLRYYLPGGWGLSVQWQFGADDFARRDMTELEAFRRVLVAAERSENDFRRQVTNGGTLDALEYVLGGLRDLPGRKAVFLVSEGIPTPGGSPGFSRGIPTPIVEPGFFQRRVRELADLANRSAAVIYTLGARGLPTLNLDASVAPPLGDLNPQWFVDAQANLRIADFEMQGPLAYLAEQTEGLFMHDNNDLAGGLHEMMDDMSGYYLIGYKPAADTFKEGKAGRGFHNIQVKLKVRGLHVRSRPGFYGIADNEVRPVNHTGAEQLKAAAVSPFSTSGVRVLLAPQFLSRGSKNSVARLRLHIDARDLTFKDAPDGRKQGTAELVALSFGDNGVVASGVEGPLKGSFQPAEFEALLKRGVDYRLDLPIKEPGGYQVRVAVRDPASQKIGSSSQFIEIPDLRPGRLALSGIVLNANVLGESGPAVRQLKAGNRVSYQLEIYNARRDSAAQAPNLESRIGIFRDGHLVSAQNPAAISQDPRDSKRLVMSGEFVLAPDSAPGDYAFLVTVTDKLAPPRYSAARRWIDFEVVP